MDRLLYSLSLVAALLLIVGSQIAPESAAMWLASTDATMNILRGILAGMMLGLLFTEPPRSFVFRVTLGLVGIVLGTMAITPLMQGSVHIADMLLFAEAAVCFLLAAIEAEPAHAEPSVIEHLPEVETGGTWLKYVGSGAASLWLLGRTITDSFGTSKQHVLHPSTRTWHANTHSMYGGGHLP